MKEFLGCRLNVLLIVILEDDARIALDLCNAETFDWTYDKMYGVFFGVWQIITMHHDTLQFL